MSKTPAQRTSTSQPAAKKAAAKAVTTPKASAAKASATAVKEPTASRAAAKPPKTQEGAVAVKAPAHPAPERESAPVTSSGPTKALSGDRRPGHPSSSIETMSKTTATAVLDHPRAATPVDPKLANAWKTKAGRELTDAEVLAMPDSEYMSDKQIEFFKFKLESLKEDLLSNAGETTEHLREDTSIVPDPADRATIEEEHALELRTRDRERKLLKKISQALARLEAGDYGYCDETGEPIGLGRLIARPTATLSLEAQQRRELKQKLFGD